MKLKEILKSLADHHAVLVRRKKHATAEPSYIFWNNEKIMRLLGKNNGYQPQEIPSAWHDIDDFEKLRETNNLPTQGMFKRSQLKERGWTDGLITKKLGEPHATLAPKGTTYVSKHQKPAHAWARHDVIIAEQDSDTAKKIEKTLAKREKLARDQEQKDNEIRRRTREEARKNLLVYLRTANFPPGFELRNTEYGLRWSPRDEKLYKLISDAGLAQTADQTILDDIAKAVKERMGELKNAHNDQLLKDFTDDVNKRIDLLRFGVRIRVDSQNNIFIDGTYQEDFYNNIIKPYFHKINGWESQKPKIYEYSQILVEKVNNRKPTKTQVNSLIEKFEKTLEKLPSPLPAGFDITVSGDSIVLCGQYGKIEKIYHLIKPFFHKQGSWSKQRPDLPDYIDIFETAIKARKPKWSHIEIRGEGYGGFARAEGSTFFDKTERYPEGEFFTVVETESRFFKEDGLTFGVGQDSGHIYKHYCRFATEEERKSVVEKMEKQRRIKDNIAEMERIFATIFECGEYPDSAEPRGSRIELVPQNIYGGGRWFIVGEEQIWVIKNNGMDNDTHSFNNVWTGGAGAIGKYVPASDTLKQELLSYATEETLAHIQDTHSIKSAVAMLEDARLHPDH